MTSASATALAQALVGRVSGRAAFAVGFAEAVPESLREAIAPLEATLPGLTLAIGGAPARACWRLQVRDQPVPVEVAPVRGRELALDGPVAQLTVESWLALLTAVYVDALQSRSLYVVDGSLVCVDGKRVLLAGQPAAGVSAAGLMLARRGYPVAAASICLLDGALRFVSGNSAYRLQGDQWAKYFPDIPRPPNWTPWGCYTLGAASVSGAGIEVLPRLPLDHVLHLHLQCGPGDLNPMPRTAHRLVAGATALARSVGCPVAVAGWRTVVRFPVSAAAIARRNQAIAAWGQVPQTKVFCRSDDVATAISQAIHG